MSMSLFRIGSNGTLNPKDEKKILDDTEQPLKRYKCLASFNKDGADTELRAFYQKNYSIVYNIFLDTLNSMNSEAKKKSKTIPTSDVLGLTDILLNLFAHSSNIIQKKWQQRSIIHTLELLLDEQNIFQIRFKGFELVVRFVDIMQDNVDNQVLDMIMNALKFKPLTEDSRDIKLPSFGQRALNTDEKLAVASSTNDLSVEEDYQLFTFFFTFMKESDHFDYWWKFFKLRLAPIFYPNECKSLDLLNKMDDMGFTEKAPTRIHLLILDVIMSGLESPKNSTILYQSDKDIYLFLMIFRQSFLLPPQHYEQLAKMMKTYRSWICRDYFLYNWPEIMERNRNLYFRIFIDNLSQIFYMKGDEQYIDLHINMSYEVLEMFMFFTQISDKIDFETWSDLLSAHKRICSTVVDRKTKGGDNYDVMYSDILEKTCFRNLYIIWIKSHPTDQYPKLWEELYELMQNYAHMPSAFGLWRATVLNLARIVCEQIFEMPTDRMRVGFIEYTTDMYTVTVVKKKAKTEKKQHIFQGMDTFMSKNISIDTVLHLFHKFLNMFGNENTQLTNGALHAKKMVVLKEVLDLFLDIEITEVKAVRGSTNSVSFLHSPEGNKLFAILLEWIIEACDRTDDQFESGRVIAYTMMCQVLVTQFSQPLNVQYLANCYRALFKGLVPEYSATDRTIEAIIKHGWNIFSMGHIGLNILVPYFVQACQKVLKESSATIGPETQELRIAAVQGLTSLIPICYFYGDRPLPHIETVLKLKQAKLENLNPETVTTFTKLRGRIVQTLQSCVQDDRFVDVQIKCIWGLYAILHNELQLEGVNGRSNPSRQIVEMFIKFFVDKNADVACAAHDAVVTLAHLGLFTKLGVPTIRTFLLTICTALSSQLKDSDSALAQWSIFKHLFYSIVEILQYIPMKVLESKEVASMLFSAINRGLSVVSLSVLLTPQKDTTTEATTEESADRGAKMYSFENYTLSKEDSALEIATAAESLLCYALNVFSQFPTPIGAARMSTEISEFDVLQEENGLYVTSPKVHHFVFNNYTLLTIMENPNKTESCVAILRDMTGKYCWEFKQVYTPETLTFKKDSSVRIDHLEFDELVDDESKNGAKNSNAPRASKAGFDSPGSPEEDRASFYVSSIVNRGDEELFDADDPRAEPIVRQDLSNVDLPSDLEQVGGLKIDKEPFETPDIKVPVTAQQESKDDSDDDEENHEEEEAMKVEEQDSQMVGDEGAEELDYPHYDIEIDTDKTDMLEVLQHYVTQVFPECAEYAKPTISTLDDLKIPTDDIDKLAASYHKGLSILEAPQLGFTEAQAPKKPDYENDNLTKAVHKAFRSLLNNIGFLSGTSRASFSLVNANGRFYRSLKQLDKLTERETIKVGLIYVANQQEAQKDILKNDETSGSGIYKEFVQSLGWDADMRTHGGFMGGLDENLTTGNTAPYYSNATTEVIFHDVTRMPTKVNDSQQIQKKRHVGNDFVHIVWSEHDRDYKPWTIPSQFNFVHICIYPYQRHKETYLFRVRIYTKPEVPLFGPLLDGMIVDKKNLGPLVRMTAINANKAVRYKQKQYRKPFPTRRSHINEIIQRHKAQSTSNIDFIKTFFLDQDYVSVEYNPKKPLAPIAATSPTTNETSDAVGSSTPNSSSRNVRNSRASIKKTDIKPEVSSQQPTTTANNTPQQQQEEVVEEQVEYEYVDEFGRPVVIGEGEEVEFIEVEEEEYQ